MGVLKNEVSNYVRDRPNLVLRDGEGNGIKVCPWLPMELPPAGIQGDRPLAQSDFLNQEVQITGKVKIGARPDACILEVISATKVPAAFLIAQGGLA